jgi:predicted lipid-binding transport protein (Tim44 family)
VCVSWWGVVLFVFGGVLCVFLGGIFGGVFGEIFGGVFGGVFCVCIFLLCVVYVFFYNY